MTQEWEHLTTIADGVKFNIDGLNIWDFAWKDTGEKIDIKDPMYGKSYSFHIYEINDSTIKVIFAAGEFSNGVFGIYRQSKKNKLSLFIEKIYKQLSGSRKS
jgi:hypothetical protein